MTSISQHKKILENIFLTTELNQAGIYAMKLFIRGKPWIITIDDTFAFLRKENNLRYAKFDIYNNALWAPLLEKAIAKVKGHYYNLVAGLPGDAIGMITGAPIFRYRIANVTEESLWKEMRKASLVQYISTITTEGRTNDEQNECGIMNRHSVSVLSSFYLRNK